MFVFPMVWKAPTALFPVRSEAGCAALLAGLVKDERCEGEGCMK